jgi:hypothetical protein
VEEEVNNTPSNERRSRVKNMLSGVHSTVALVDVAIARVQELKAMGFRTYAALHFSERSRAKADIQLHQLYQGRQGRQDAALYSRQYAWR